MYLGLILIVTSLGGLVTGIDMYFSGRVVFVEWEIVSFFRVVFVMTFILDWMRLTFIGFVAIISSLVLFYSTSYMSGDRYFYRFIMLVYLFVISMFLLILRPNLVRILLGWDGLGLVSYCLVIYYQNEKSVNAGILTILSNRVGDVAILLRIAWMRNFGSWNFYFLQLIFTNQDLFFILFIVILAGITKRAQIPFSAWLPAAIAAPTPVSALVHSSTLVTAGVYLLIRFEALLGLRSFLFMVGTLTIFMSGLGANFETDLKKIIALSTLSQLGVIIIILGLGISELAFFHLLRHALFKSLLFLCAGVFIHGIGDIQDIRLLGGMELRNPVRSLYFVGSSLALCGFPFLAGFYSKDIILESYMMIKMNFFTGVLVVIGTAFTVTYSVRLGYFLFLKNLGLKRILFLEEEILIAFPIRILFFRAVTAGGCMSVQYFPSYYVFLPFLFKVAVLVILIFLVTFILTTIENLIFYIIEAKEKLVHFLGGIWFLPTLSTVFIIPVLKIGGAYLKDIDQGWVEYWGAQGLNNNLSQISFRRDFFSLLNLKTYLLIGFIVVVFFCLWIYLNSSRRARFWSSRGKFSFQVKLLEKYFIFTTKK